MSKHTLIITKNDGKKVTVETDELNDLLIFITSFLDEDEL